MSVPAIPHGQSIEGIIRRRLLVNVVVDPDEARSHLPGGLRPQVVDAGTVVGCCLLEIDAVRPAALPMIFGRRIRAAAHRISVEWDDESGATVSGVYVPVRHTDSRLAVISGGRLFPGVHERARVEMAASDGSLYWRSEPSGGAHLGIRVHVSYRDTTEPTAICDPVGTACLAADVGVSPDHHGHLEGTRMDLSHRLAREVIVEDLQSDFVDSFATAERSKSYLLSDAAVTWRRAVAPPTSVRASA